MTIEVVNGVRRNFGPRDAEDKVPGKVLTAGEVKEIVVDFNYDDLPTNSTNDALVQLIPAYAAVTQVLLFVKTTFAGGTDIQIGTEQADGTDVDLDGFVTAAQGAVANLVAGYVVSGRGAQVVESPDAAGTAHIDADGVYAAGANGPIASVATQIKVTANGTFTAGAAKLLVRYVLRS